MNSLVIIGFILIAVLMYVLVKGKMSPIVAFITLPIIAAFCAGFSPEDIGNHVKNGISSMTTTASMFAFSISYFSIMSDVGLFDPILSRLTGKNSRNVFAILLCVLAATFVAHLDGSGATTFLVVVPAFLPLCKKIGIRPEALLCTICGTYAINNLLPWGGPTTRTASVLEMDTTALYLKLVPGLITIGVLSIALAFIVSRIEIKNGAGQAVAAEADAEDNNNHVTGDVHSAKYWINVVLTVVVFILLFAEIFPTNLCFMLGTALALLINFPKTKEQTARIKSYAVQAMSMTMTLFAVGVFLGIMSKGGIIDEMATFLINMIPGSMAAHAHWIIALFSVPLIMMLSTDAFYYVLLPIVLGVVTPYGVSPQTVAATFLLTATFGTAISPGVAAVYVGLGLADVDIGTHIKYSFKILWPMSIICLIICTLIGVIQF